MSPTETPLPARSTTDSSSRPRVVSAHVLRGSPRDRTPPGQTLTAKWPVLHYGSVPKVDPHAPDWRLRIFGLCDDPYELTYDEIRAMPGRRRRLRHALRHALEPAGQHLHRRPHEAAHRPRQAQARSQLRHVPQRSRLHGQCPAGRIHRRRLHPRLPVGRQRHRPRPRLARSAAWSPASTSGKAPSGSAASNSAPPTPPASGNKTATTCTETPGRKNASGGKPGFASDRAAQNTPSREPGDWLRFVTGAARPTRESAFPAAAAVFGWLRLGSFRHRCPLPARQKPR